MKHVAAFLILAFLMAGLGYLFLLQLDERAAQTPRNITITQGVK